MSIITTIALVELTDLPPLQFVEEEVEVDALTQARSYHESFIETHSRGFVGRTKILDKLHQYVAAVRDLLYYGEEFLPMN